MVREILRFTVGTRFREVSLNVMTRRNKVIQVKLQFGLPAVGRAGQIRHSVP